MESVLVAEPAELFHFKSVRVVLLVLHRVVVPLLAFGTSKRNLDSHLRHLLVMLDLLPPLSQDGPLLFLCNKKRTPVER